MPPLRDGREAGRGERCQPSSSSAARWAEEEQPAAKANPEPPCEHRGGRVTPGASIGCARLQPGPPLSACWNSLLDNYRQITSSKQHFYLRSLAHIHLASASWKESCRAAETRLGNLPAAQQGGERQELLLIPTSPALPQHPGAGHVQDTLIKIENMQQVNSRLLFQVPPPCCCCKRSPCGSLTPGGAALCYFHPARRRSNALRSCGSSSRARAPCRCSWRGAEPAGHRAAPRGPNPIPEEPLASAFFHEKAQRDFSCPGFKALGLDIHRAIVCRSLCLSTLAVENASCFQ